MGYDNNGGGQRRNFDDGRLGDYVDVAARIVEFRSKFPAGSLQPANLGQPFQVVTIGDQTFVAVVAAAYRTPDDTRPGVGMAYEPFPGRTPYTKGSELQNAETAAWGRAIVAALAADTKKGVASADEVRNRNADRDQGVEQDRHDAAWRRMLALFADLGATEPADQITRAAQVLNRDPATITGQGSLTQADVDTVIRALLDRKAQATRAAA